MNAAGLLSDKRDVDVCWFLVLSVNYPRYVFVCACVCVKGWAFWRYLLYLQYKLLRMGKR